MLKQHLYIKVVQGRWYATDLNGKWLTAQETAQAIADGATYKFAYIHIGKQEHGVSLNCTGKTCLNCKYARWRRTLMGKLHPNQLGKCSYNIVLPALPKSLYFLGGYAIAGSGIISRNKPFTDCPTWAEL